MPLQYISDIEGNHTGVLIPIKEWEQLTIKHEDLKQLENPKTNDLRKPSDFIGTMSHDIAEKMQEYIKRSREEWG